jgi:hypothetical protein
MAYVLPAAIVAAMIGFLVGLIARKQFSRWCPICGATLRCVACTRWAEVSPPGGGPPVPALGARQRRRA